MTKLSTTEANRANDVMPMPPGWSPDSVRDDGPAGGVVGAGFEKIQPARLQQARLER